MSFSWKDCLWRNLKSSYLAAGTRLAVGLILFPILFRHMTREQFGFWSLLWGIVTYTVLMDFGIGSTARIEVARRAHHDDWSALNALLSTMFWSYALVFAGIIGTVLAIRPWALTWLGVGNNPEFSNAYIIFAVTIGLSVPLGLVGEILRGLQRMDIVCMWWSIGQVANLGLLSLGVYAGWPFDMMVLASAVATAGPTIGMTLDLKALVPQLSLAPRLFDLSRLRPVLAFSIVAYLLSIANLVIARTDQLVIGLCLGISTVAIYQAGFKVADVYGFGLLQIGELLSPAAAQSREMHDHHDLVNLLTRSIRGTALVGTPLFVLCLIYLRPMIHLLTGLSPVPNVYWLVGVVLLVGRFSSLLTHSCACPVFLGAGYERKLLGMTLSEAAANLGLSLVLAYRLGVVGVALGTAIPAVLIGWGWAVPLTLRFTGLGVADWLRRVYRPVLAPVTLSCITALAGAILWPVVTVDSAPTYHYVRMLGVGAFSLLPVAVHLHRYVARILSREKQLTMNDPVLSSCA